MTQITSGLTSPFLILSLCLLATGSWLCFFALRRKRKGDQPHCRKCEYQLTGIATEQTHCPECGFDLRSNKAIIKGDHYLHKPLLIAGIIIALLSLGMLGHAGYTLHAHDLWLDYKPTTWLIDDAVAEFAAKSNRNRQELFKRANDMQLSDKQLAILAEKTVKLQTQNTTNWQSDPDWASILDLLLEQRIVTQDQIQQLIVSNLKLELTAKPVIPLQNSLHCRTEEGVLHISKYLDFSYQRVSRRITANDQLLKEIVAKKPPFARSTHRNGSTSYSLDMDKPPLSEWINQPIKLTYSQDLVVRVNHPSKYQPFEFTESDSMNLRIIPADGLADTFITDEKLIEPMDQAWHRTRVIQTRSRTKVWIELENIPVNMAMQVFVIDQGKQHYAGHLLVNEVLPKKWYMAQVKRNYKLSDKVNVLLRPSQHAANSQMNLAEYWGKPMSRKDIQVNAPYEPALNMDKTIIQQMQKNISIEIDKHNSNKSLSMTLRFYELPANVNYILMANINGKWRRMYYSPFNVIGRPDSGNSNSFWTYRHIPPEFKTITFRLVPNDEWELMTRDFIPPWGYGLEFKDIPLPDVNKKGSDKRYTGKVILTD